jgi:hypothetical protein
MRLSLQPLTSHFTVTPRPSGSTRKTSQLLLLCISGNFLKHKMASTNGWRWLSLVDTITLGFDSNLTMIGDGRIVDGRIVDGLWSSQQALSPVVPSCLAFTQHQDLIRSRHTF